MLNFDSKEEKYFYYWLEEIKTLGFIDKIERGDEIAFTLSEKVVDTRKVQMKTKDKDVEFSLLQPHVYTPDFRITWNQSAKGKFFSVSNFDDRFLFVANSGGISYIEIKPAFDAQNMTRLFGINQKWMMQKFGIFVQKIIPYKTGKKAGNCFFKETFIPQQFIKDRAIVGKDKPPLLHFDSGTLEEFIKKMNF